MRPARKPTAIAPMLIPAKGPCAKCDLTFACPNFTRYSWLPFGWLIPLTAYIPRREVSLLLVKDYPFAEDLTQKDISQGEALSDVLGRSHEQIDREGEVHRFANLHRLLHVP